MTNLTPFNYAVVQFHHNPLRHEPFNLGLLALSDRHPAFVRFEPNIKNLLKLDQVEYRVVDACIAQIRDSVKRSSNPSFLNDLLRSYTGKIQLTEIRGGLAEDVLSEAEKLFQMFVAHPRRRAVRGPEKGAAKDLRVILREKHLLGKHKVQRNYTIVLNEVDQVKLDFGYAFDSGHVAIEAVDLTMPGREERLEEVGPVSGKFQFLGDQLKHNVKRFAAVKMNGVDAGWELQHIRDSSDAVFNIDVDAGKLIDKIEQHFAASR